MKKPDRPITSFREILASSFSEERIRAGAPGIYLRRGQQGAAIHVLVHMSDLLLGSDAGQSQNSLSARRNIGTVASIAHTLGGLREKTFLSDATGTLKTQIQDTLDNLFTETDSQEELIHILWAITQYLIMFLNKKLMHTDSSTEQYFSDARFFDAIVLFTIDMIDTWSQ